jgi:tetratricopeptide (TPR) repeat protein
VGTAESSFDTVLREAKEHYFQGEPQAARELLQGLQLRLYAGEEAPWATVVEALTYLGEIYYVQGNQQQAEIAFRYLLERDPQTPISPFHHTIEVVNLFELVRTTVLAEQEDLPPVLAPVSTYLPLGIPQLAQGRTGAGLLYGGLQTALVVTSIVTFVQVDGLNGPEPRLRPRLPQQEREQRVAELRYGVQWPATFGFYMLWGISTIDAARWHQRHLGRQKPVSLGLSLQGSAVVLSGDF